MDSLAVPAISSSTPIPLDQYNPQDLADSTIIQSIAEDNDDGDVTVDVDDLFKNLSFTAQRVIESLNELLKGTLPEGIQSLKIEDHTPEKTAERIVSQVTGLFGIYAAQNKDLEGEDLVNGFMETIRGGVQKGYDEAFKILGDIGAFDLDGIQSGVEKTKALIEEKLSSFERQLRIQLGIDPAPEPPLEERVTSPTRDQFLAQGGARSLDVVV